MRYANKDYLEVAADSGFVGKPEPIIMQFYSEPLQKFQAAVTLACVAAALVGLGAFLLKTREFVGGDATRA